MIELWLSAALITVITLGIVLLPLIRKPKIEREQTSSDFDMVVYNDQLDEVERDLQRGLIDQADAEAVRTEIKRRILTAIEAPDKKLEDTRSLSMIIAVGLFFIIPLGSVGLYYKLGQPNMPDFAYADRDIAREKEIMEARQNQQQKLEETTTKLSNELRRNPDNLRGWVLLGQTYSTMGRYDEAIQTYARAREFAPQSDLIDLNYAEVLVLAKNNIIGEEPLAIMKQVIKKDPENARARYYVALAKLQNQDTAGALQDWVNLRALATPDAPWLGLVNEQITQSAADLNIIPSSIKPSAETLQLAAKIAERDGANEATQAPGPTAEQIQQSAAMSDGDRTAFIRKMVNRLATRLKDNPEDIEGWKRLAKAYTVLGETDLAKAANEKIMALSK